MALNRSWGNFSRYFTYINYKALTCNTKPGTIKNVNKFQCLNISRNFHFTKSHRKNIEEHVKSKIKVKKRRWPYVILFPSCFAAGFYFIQDDVGQRKICVAYAGVIRFFRTLYVGCRIILDYKWSLRSLEKYSDEYNELSKPVHERAAELILWGCLKNEGLYVKLGQGLVSMNHILPKEYVTALEVLQDRALKRRENEVEQILMEDFGLTSKNIFSEFEKEPIAAASLAQVHRAKLKTGERVAVKIQYIDLQDRYEGDIFTIETLLGLVALVFPDFGFRWVFQDMKHTLAQELDFLNEGKNSERCAKDLKSLRYVYIPKVFWDVSSKRVLTMEYIDGCKITDIESIKKLGLPIKEVNRKLVNCFAHQVFQTGFVHADPHPGNVFVRKGKTGKAQLVLLDHGLYDYLNPEKRMALCKLFKGIVTKDEAAMERYATEMGVRDWPILCMMLVQRPIRVKKFSYMPENSHGQKSPMAPQNWKKLSDEDKEKLQNLMKEMHEGFNRILCDMPKPLFLILRNINTIRAISHVHNHPVDRYSIMAWNAIKGAYNDNKNLGISGRIRIVKDNFYFRYMIWSERLIYDVGRKLMLFYFKILYFFGRGPDMVKMIEDIENKSFGLGAKF